jgi:hypothetical protein
MAKVQLKLENTMGQQETMELDPDSELKIDENNLEGEACRQIQLMVEYGRAWALTKAQVLRAEGEIKITEALLSSEFRSKAISEGKKVTEGAVEGYIQGHPKYIQAIQDRLTASVLSSLTYSWWATVQQRAEMLKLIGYRQNTEIKYGE